MNIENIFTESELALIDSGNYKPGRAVLDTKLDLMAAYEREACAKLCESHVRQPSRLHFAEAIRARGEHD